MNEPDLVLADEPTGNLDEKTAQSLHAELIRLSRDLGQTFVVVTHNRDFADMADREMILEHGRLKASSSD
jgi:lipoprotein-releasing system ATP-binding protein